jgi:hypothetical protein
MRPTDARPAR